MKLVYYIDKIKRFFVNGYLYTKYSVYEPGHYYSPILNISEFKKNKLIFDEELLDIQLNETLQLETWNSISKYFEYKIPDSVKGESLRYKFDNIWYANTDGIILYGILRYFNPKKIIEVGSGFSSALMLDTNEFSFDNQIDLTFIEPFPSRLNSLLKEKDKKQVVILEKNVQTVDLNIFKKLEANDILFIDSSHVSKTNSDVNFLFFKVFPILSSGVIIHIHDVFYPFEYRYDWIESGRQWNEIYLLRAFLQNNENYEIILFTDFIQQKHPVLLGKNENLKIKNGNSIYLRKK
jgi:predicted O-methyltransferase YrrM